jgi:hypothetical protein
MNIFEHIPTGSLLLAGVSSENQEFLRAAYLRQPTKEEIATAMLVACEAGQSAMVQYMLIRGAEPDKHSLWAACRNGKLETIKLLIDTGAEITSTEESMLTRWGHADVINQLQ